MWYRWVPDDLNGNDFRAKIVEVTDGAADVVNLDYLAMYTQYHLKPALSPPFMHVDSITLSQQGTLVKQLTSSVKIVDARLDPVRSAMVSFTVTDETNGTQWVRMLIRHPPA